VWFQSWVVLDVPQLSINYKSIDHDPYMIGRVPSWGKTPMTLTRMTLTRMSNFLTIKFTIVVLILGYGTRNDRAFICPCFSHLGWLNRISVIENTCKQFQQHCQLIIKPSYIVWKTIECIESPIGGSGSLGEWNQKEFRNLLSVLLSITLQFVICTYAS